MKKILVVDDEPGVLMSAKMLLQGQYEVDTESDPDKAESKAVQNGYNTIFLDITMPKRSGLDVLKNMIAKGVKSPIYMISGWGGVGEIMVEGVKCGAKGFMEKPFNSEKIKEAIENQ